jgi:hypothetical protein
VRVSLSKITPVPPFLLVVSAYVYFLYTTMCFLDWQQCLAAGLLNRIEGNFSCSECGCDGVKDFRTEK